MTVIDKPFVSIILRTLNEESWLKSCVQAIRLQSFQAFEIILVDSGSEDATVELARQLGITKICTVSDYKPGLAINMGARLAKGDFLVILSAHCIPENHAWLSSLVTTMEDKQFAGAYGRQLPLDFTSPDDARDLLMAFGIEDRTQEQDPMFHNANSIVRANVWREFPFDEELSNIEDRVWAQQVISCGYKIKYVSDAKVYHYHGIHQHGHKQSFRAAQVNKIIRSIDNTLDDSCPPFLDYKMYLAPILITSVGEVNQQRLEKLICEIHEFIDQPIYLLSDVKPSIQVDKVNWIRRSENYNLHIDLGDLLLKALNDIENREGKIIDALGFLDDAYLYPRVDLLVSCLNSLFKLNYSAVFPTYVDNGSFWVEKEGVFKTISSSFKNRNEKPKIYRACYGLGSFLRASILRRGLALKNNNGIIPFYDMKYVLRNRATTLGGEK